MGPDLLPLRFCNNFFGNLIEVLTANYVSIELSFYRNKYYEKTRRNNVLLRRLVINFTFFFLFTAISLYIHRANGKEFFSKLKRVI